MIKMLNSDEISSFYKTEYLRIYNMLMVCVVNDTKKSMRVAQLIAQAFKLLMDSPLDDFLQEQQVPEEWYLSPKQVTNKEFEECQIQF